MTPEETQTEATRAHQRARAAAIRNPGTVVFVTALQDGYYDHEQDKNIFWTTYDYTTAPQYYHENELLTGYCYDAETQEMETL